MSRYLDPKIDLVFKRIFGEHPHILKSFLNAVLPLPEEGLIVDLDYLPAEQVPEIPSFKNTIADVRCTDKQGRIFIVEMQIEWIPSFRQRLLYGVSKAYVRQLNKSEAYHALRPVYGLGLINAIFDQNSEDWYHHYQLMHKKSNQNQLQDIQLLFIELPKFKAHSFTDKKLQVLWLRFMSELDEKMTQVPAEWLAVPEIETAVQLAAEAAYTPAELEYCDQYWDSVRIQRSYVADAEVKGEAKGEIKGINKTLAAITLIQQGEEDEAILHQTGLSAEVLKELRQKIAGLN